MNSKLSHRLHTIHTHAPLNPHIFDIGCDHGDLGLSFLSLPQVQSLSLVDPSDDVIDQLKEKLAVSDIPKQIHVLKKRADQLKIETKKNTLIMCGFGGSQIAEGIAHLKPQLDSDSVFVLSPHGHFLQLREFLSQGEFDLLVDAIIFDEGQFYPLLVIGNRQGRAVHPFGEEDLWHSSVGARYRERLLRVYKNHKDPRDQSFFRYLESL